MTGICSDRQLLPVASGAEGRYRTQTGQGFACCSPQKCCNEDLGSAGNEPGNTLPTRHIDESVAGLRDACGDLFPGDAGRRSVDPASVS